MYFEPLLDPIQSSLYFKYDSQNIYRTLYLKMWLQVEKLSLVLLLGTRAKFDVSLNPLPSSPYDSQFPPCEPDIMCKSYYIRTLGVTPNVDQAEISTKTANDSNDGCPHVVVGTNV